MSDPRAPHDPRDPRAPHDPLAPHTTRGPNDPHRAGSGGMPGWGWAAIAGVVLLLAVLFMWPTAPRNRPISRPGRPPRRP
jgi:hypothetical protein